MISIDRLLRLIVGGGVGTVHTQEVGGGEVRAWRGAECVHLPALSEIVNNKRLECTHTTYSERYTPFTKGEKGRK